MYERVSNRGQARPFEFLDGFGWRSKFSHFWQVGVLIKQIIWKKAKILNGFIRTHVRRSGESYDPAPWFDRFYGSGVSDRQTIASDKDVTSAQYHYASVELLITRYLVNHGISVQGASVFDIGSGAGHWINFYKKLGAEKCVGIDVSEHSVNFLRDEFRDDSSVQMNKVLFQDYLEKTTDQYDLINAIGVMFHVVDDVDWRRGLAVIANSLRDGGHLVVGGNFGVLNNINIQFDTENKINKRLRSKRVWAKTLKCLGFSKCVFYRNNAYLFINDTLPENNILIATK